MKFVQRQPLFQLLEKCIPADHSRPTQARDLAGLAKDLAEQVKVLDVGCGVGNTIDLFAAKAPDASWYGVDLHDSPEVRNRVRTDGNFSSFDGVNLPYEDEFFDMVYCCQVLEHVRHPDRLVPEIQRVLKPGGIFLGSVSYLEPYHSYSVFNFTPYGVQQVLQSAGFKLKELRPGIDAITLIMRQLLGKPRWFGFFERHSVFYFSLNLASRVTRLSTRENNFLKLQFSGHICFLAAKPAADHRGDKGE